MSRRPVDPVRSPYLTRREVCERLAISRATSYRYEREGYLPRPLRLGPGVLRWRRDELEAFEERAAEDRGSPTAEDRP